MRSRTAILSAVLIFTVILALAPAAAAGGRHRAGGVAISTGSVRISTGAVGGTVYYGGPAAVSLRLGSGFPGAWHYGQGAWPLRRHGGEGHYRRHSPGRPYYVYPAGGGVSISLFGTGGSVSVNLGSGYGFAPYARQHLYAPRYGASVPPAVIVLPSPIRVWVPGRQMGHGYVQGHWDSRPPRTYR